MVAKKIKSSEHKQAQPRVPEVHSKDTKIDNARDSKDDIHFHRSIFLYPWIDFCYRLVATKDIFFFCKG